MKKNKTVFCSIIILNYRTPELTCNCLKSLFQAQIPLAYEVIVLDNNSGDKSAEIIKKKFPRIKLIKSKINLGFAGGNNLAAQSAQGKYMLFLNSDTLLFPDTLTRTFNFVLQTKLQPGVVGIKLLNKDQTVQRSVFRFPSLRFFLADVFFLPLFGLFDDYRYFSYQTIKLVDFVAGAFMLIPAKLFKKAHGFDDTFFMYAEETDLCYRLKKLGYPTVFYPGASLVHLGGGSAENNQKKEALGLKSKIIFINKHLWPKTAFLLLGLGNLLRGILGSTSHQRKKYYYLSNYYFNNLFK